MRAYWTESNSHRVTDQESLAQVIAQVLALGEPTMLFLEHEDGRTLVVGIGAEESVLTYVNADGTSFHSVGDVGRNGWLKFSCREQVDDFLAEMAVPFSIGLKAAQWFAGNPETSFNAVHVAERCFQA